MKRDALAAIFAREQQAYAAEVTSTDRAWYLRSV